jgi:hypothetical protein
VSPSGFSFDAGRYRRNLFHYRKAARRFDRSAAYSWRALMSLVQILVLIVLAGLVTPPCVLFIPRACQSLAFDRVLWVATWLLALFGALAVPNYIGTEATLKSVIVAEVPLIPTLLGAIAGSLSVNLLLWVLDRFDQPSIEETAPEAEPTEREEG